MHGPGGKAGVSMRQNIRHHIDFPRWGWSEVAMEVEGHTDHTHAKLIVSWTKFQQ